MKLVHVGARRDHPDHDYGDARVSRDVMALAEDPEIDVLVGATAGGHCGTECWRSGRPHRRKRCWVPYVTSAL